MKKILCVLLLIAILPAYAQDLSTEVQKEYMAYSALLKAKDFDKVLDYTHPGLFEVYPKDQLKAALEQVFNNPQIQIELSDPVLSEFAPAKQVEANHYVKFKSMTVTKMKFGFFDELPEADKANALAMMKDNLKAQFGEDNFSYDEKTGFFTVTANNQMLAVSQDKKGWKFVDVSNKQQRPILEKFIPAEFF